MTRLTHDPGNDPIDDGDLPALRAPGAGRRTDDAFARSVAGDVDAVRAARAAPRRALGWLAAPALAVAAAAAFVVVGADSADSVGGNVVGPAGAAVANVDAGGAGAGDDDADAEGVEDERLAFADVDDENDGGLFAIPVLEGSTDSELEDIEAALDRALKL